MWWPKVWSWGNTFTSTCAPTSAQQFNWQVFHKRVRLVPCTVQLPYCYTHSLSSKLIWHGWYYLTRCAVNCTGSVQSINGFSCQKVTMIQRFAGWLSTGEGKWAVALKCLIRLGCLVQRLTVHCSYCQLPFAYCTGQPTCKPLYVLHTGMDKWL